jgi:glycerophosphoryl diester phosphodiesterase
MNRLECLPQPVIFGHRGASRFAPENTLAAFDLACQQGADAVEFDVKLTADAQVVIIHDARVDRTTNGSGFVKNLTLTQMQALDAGSSFSEQFAGEPVPTLANLFDHMDEKIFYNIELTNYTTQNDILPEKTAELVRRYHQEDNVLFSSFSIKTLARMHALLPQVPVAMLAPPGLAGIFKRNNHGLRAAPYALHPHLSDVSQALMLRQKELNRRVHVWTVNDNGSMRRMFDYGVNGIITDDPLLGLRMRAA